MVLKTLWKKIKQKPKQRFPFDELIIEKTQYEDSSGRRSTDPLKNAYSFDRLNLLDDNCESFCKIVDLKRALYPDAAPYILDEVNMNTGETIKGYIVLGIDLFPQFIREKELKRYLSIMEKRQEEAYYDEGVLVYDQAFKVTFIPKTIYKLDRLGFPIQLEQHEKALFKPPRMVVYHKWMKGKDDALAARLEREKEKREEEEEAKEKALAAAAAAGAVAGAAVPGAGAAGGSGAVAAGIVAGGAGEGGAGAAAARAGAVDGAAGAGAGAGVGTGGVGGAGARVVDEKKVDATKKDKQHAKKKAEKDAPTTSKTELTKSQVETVWWKKTWFFYPMLSVPCVVGLAVLGGIIYGILLACGVVPSNSSSSSTDAVTQSTGALSNHVDGSGSGGSGGSGGGNPQSTSSTTPTTTTTTRAYPAMTAIQRVPVVNLMKPTFEIVSASFQLGLQLIHPFAVFADTKVIYVLNITSSTSVIQLRWAYKSTGDITVKDLNGGHIADITNKTSDERTELLTLRLSKPLNKGAVKLSITITPLKEAFEQISHTCGQKKCSVFVNRKLSLLVPHFDRYTKHKWSIEVTHPVEVAVVMNTKAKSGSTSTPTRFLETPPILPSELSIVIIENFSKQVSGTKVEYYLPSGTLAKEATGMIATLGNGLATKAKPSIPTGEMFFFIVIPAMDNYQFCGRNVALVGTSLLRSNTEVQQDFVWTFIFRTVIYDKVTSADKKSSWVYEQSALFLSTSIKSTNKNLWKKHYYEIVMNSGRDDMKALVNQSIVYEDERRYLEKRHHVAKVSTILAMFVSVNNDTSTDPLTVLDTVRSNETSSQFFFIKSQLKIGNGAPVNVDRVISCYVDTPVTPRLHINRTSPTHVAIRRSSGGPTDGCDTHLWLEKGQKIGTTVNKEHKVLSGSVENIEVESNSPILLSGETPFSAHGYTMEQSEFDRLLDVSVVKSYDESSLKMLAFNAFNAAAEGILSYESVKTFIKLLVSQKVLTVDEAVDLWMEPVLQSRNVEMFNLTEKIVASVLNLTGQPTDGSIVPNYINPRFEKSPKEGTPFEIEKMTNLMKRCGELCLGNTNYYLSVKCVFGNDKGCSYNPHFLEMYVCSAIALGDENDYTKFDNLYNQCIGKPCQLSTLRGILCSKNTANLQSWMNKVTSIDTTDMINRQVVLTICQGLVFNEVSRPMVFPYFLENWHLIHQKYSNSPALLGEIVEILSSTMYTSEELTQFQQFVAFYGDNLAMYKEFEEQAEKAKKVVEWNEKYSKDFIQIFA